MPASLLDLSATAAVAAMRDGDLRAEDYARALLDRAREFDHLNSFRTLNVDLVLEAARDADRARQSGQGLGALHGLPIPVKDSVNTRMLPTSNGTAALRNFQPKTDAGVLQRLFAQGAILMGKTNLHELSRGYTSNNAAFGPCSIRTIRPMCPAEAAADPAPLSLHDRAARRCRRHARLDQGPRKHVRHRRTRPTPGRYPNDGIMSLTLAKFDQCGPLARHVVDLALFDSAVTGEQPGLPLAKAGRRASRSRRRSSWRGGCDVDRITHEVVQRLRDAGATIVRPGFQVNVMNRWGRRR